MKQAQTKPQILIVDDKPQNLFALEALLGQLDVEVIQTTSGAEALGLALEHDFALGIIDVQMPGMDGYELVELLRGNPTTASLPVIFVSAIYSDEYHHRKGYDAGAVDFLSKPFIAEILLSKVGVFLDLYHQRVRLQALINELNDKNEALIQVTGELQEANVALSKRAVQLEASNQVSQQITSVLELNELLTAVVRSIQTKFGYYFVGVWLLNEAKDRVILQAGLGRDGSQRLEPGWPIELDTGHGIIAWVARSGQVYRADDVSVDDRFLVMDLLPETRSEVAFPLRIGQEVIGVLDIQSDQVARFDDEDQRMLQTLTNQIAIAIRNARLYELEKQLNTDKDKFFSIISHDLRSPFTSLLGNTELMVKMIDRLSQEDIREMSQSINNQAKAAHRLLENLLTWSQLQRGRIEYDPGPVELHQLVGNTVTLLQEVAQSKEIQLEQTIEDELFVYADKYMIDTVIRNLTSNALKFTPPGGQVILSARPNGFLPGKKGPSWVEVSVIDTGVGISPEDIDKLFKIEVHHTTPGTAQEQGTGLGLILCREMVEKNGGHIWVESELGQGTTVKFTVPIAVAEKG
ncbi:MAG: hybrid sensor histidine kinase/response regulator [Anaerolineae bacterium]|nr:hybrid sensor histidine kinase/response regulator [Anaerolineae bacterium]